MKVIEYQKLKEYLVDAGISTEMECFGNGSFNLEIEFKNFHRKMKFPYGVTPYDVLEKVVSEIENVYPYSKKSRPLKKIIREQSFHDYEKKDNGYSKENLPFFFKY